MDPSSPAKRRALAPLDKNAMSPTTKLGAKPTPNLRASSPSKPSGLKRSLQIFGADENGAAKKQCQEPQEPAPRSVSADEENGTPRDEEPPMPEQQGTRSSSPDAPSVFDNSITEGSQEDTTLTEPDAAAAATTTTTVVAPRPRRVMTREQARQSAEILRLRLGLATYKVRTGQTDVPLERLEVRPIPGLVSLRREVTGSQSTSSSQESSQSKASQKDGETSTRGVRFAPGSVSPEKSALPRLASAVNTPQRARLLEEDDKLTSSALRGGAANGLLSLARGR